MHLAIGCRISSNSSSEEESLPCENCCCRDDESDLAARIDDDFVAEDSNEDALFDEFVVALCA